uniref:hypothetical protein n=1 Tax=Prevotella sp. TaxID=59823 RepID=UPI004028E23E
IIERAKALKLKAFALSGRQVYIHKYPGRCPGLGASALSGRVDAKHTLLRSAGYALSSVRRPGGFAIRRQKMT